MKYFPLALIFIASCSAPIAPTKPEFSETPPAVEPKEVDPILEMHNKERSKRGLDELSLDRDMCSYAQKHAESMSKSNRLYHSSMSALLKASEGSSVAENIAWGQESEEEVMKSWMTSSGHKRNILGNYKKMGFGSSKAKDGTIYWCVVFSS